MIDVSKRSYQKELLDDDNIPFADIRRNMQELNSINQLLGGHAITINGFKKILGEKSSNNTITICEIGCGGGDNLNAIYNHCKKNKIDCQFIGIDIKPQCIAFAKEQYPNMPATWLIADYKTVDFDLAPDIIFSSLFCHHFTDDVLILQLQWMKQKSVKGFFINDLHRHPLAYQSIKLITRLLSKSYLVKNDAPLSVARAFKKNEWLHLLNSAGITNAEVEWKWAFRHLITFRHD